MIEKDEIIYLDNNATTQVDPEVVEVMLPYLRDYYGNPSSLYRFGSQVGKAIEKSREQVAALLGCHPEEVVFTSCGTESNNTAIESGLRVDRDRPDLVTTQVEHSAVVKHGEKLSRDGRRVTWIGVDGEGRLDVDGLKDAVDDETGVVSIMWANNETGVLFPISEIAEQLADSGVFFHTDAVQAVGKIPLNVSALPIHFLSLSGHKLHCPKGVGALYVSRKARFYPYLIGGGQENGKRGGTENVASIVGLGKAAELAMATMEHENTVVRKMRDDFEQRILAEVSGVQVNGGGAERLPNTSSLAFDGVDSEGLLIVLDKDGICASAGSACTTGSLTPSHVLTAMGISAERAHSSLRFSFGRFNRPEELDNIVEMVKAGVEKVRSLRPADGSPVMIS